MTPAYKKIRLDDSTAFVYAVQIGCRDCAKNLWRGEEEHDYQQSIMPQNFRS